MLWFLKSIFGSGGSRGNYPESLLKQAVERVVDGTDPNLRAVAGYKKKLRPAVISSIDHVIALEESLPIPVPFSLAAYSDDPVLKRFFISADEMRNTLAGDRSLAAYLAEVKDAGPVIHTVLAMEKEERATFGAALSGDVVVHDVPQVTVSFDAFRFFDPSGNVQENSFNLKKRAFDHLISLALKRLTGIKSERKDLERWRTLLQSKLGLLQRGGWGLQSEEPEDASQIEEQLGRIEAQLREIGGDDRCYDAYLESVVAVLGHPEDHLLARAETIFVDRMGIRREEPSDDAAALPLTVLYNAEGRSLVVLPVTIRTDELRSLAGVP